LYFKTGKFDYHKPSEIRFKFKADNFFKRKAQLPIIHKQGYVFALQVEQEAIKLEALKNAMNENRDALVESIKIPKPGHHVDLHIEKLTNETNLSNSEMLRIQLGVFQSALDAALVNNMDEIVFIHGVGNGVLRNEIHKRLSSTKGIKFFEDAAKEKFGYGATKVRLK
jgi:dsDNA-specific endonuclease/ATPase MutS2